MKKLSVIALMLVGVIMTSCKKEEPTFCYECVTSDVGIWYDGTAEVHPFKTETICGIKPEEESSLEYNTYITTIYHTTWYEVRTCERKQ